MQKEKYIIDWIKGNALKKIFQNCVKVGMENIVLTGVPKIVRFTGSFQQGILQKEEERYKIGEKEQANEKITLSVNTEKVQMSHLFSSF